MILAELDIRHSRPVAPTRRVALGEMWLPTDPPPGFGGLLLGAVLAQHLGSLDADDRVELRHVIDDCETQRRISQPRLRHRYQDDIVGLDHSTHQLVAVGRAMALESQVRGSDHQQALGAVYAAARLPPHAQPAVFAQLRRALRWLGRDQQDMLRYLSSETTLDGWLDISDHAWARELFGFDDVGDLDRDAVLTRFRELIRVAHPDSGGTTAGASLRVTDLARAKRILLIN